MLTSIKSFSLSIRYSFLLIGWLFFYPFAFSHSLAEKEKVQVELSQLPLLFEKNEGQADASVLYLTRGAGCTFYFRPHDLLMLLKKEIGQEKYLFFPIKMEFVGASPYSQARGEEEQECKSNYFIGNNPATWKTSLSNYAKLRYDAVYPGIDLLFYGNPQQLEYDILVSPGARPETIRLRFQGIDQLSLTSTGDLRLLVSGGEEVVITKPLLYQMMGEERIPIDGQFVLVGPKEVGFALGDYDSHRTLIIDPTLVYSTYLGGNQFDSGNAIAVDGNGNAYVTGGTSSTNFPTTAGAFQPALDNNAFQNAFISKLDSTGTSLIYSTYLGGDNSTLGNGIALDNDGNAYLTGLTSSSNFPTFNAVQPSLGGNGAQNAFITKLREDGQALIYSTYLGGNNFDEGKGIALDPATNAYITGSTLSSTFPTTLGAFQTASNNGSNEAFITKLRADGQMLLYSTYLGGSNFDQANAIAVNNSGNAYVTGYTLSTDFPTTSNTFQQVLEGAQNAFITKMSPDGRTLVYSSYLGGNSVDEGKGIALDRNDNAYVTGSTDSTNFPTTSQALQKTLNGDNDAFVTKIDPEGSTLIYSTYLGGSNDDEGNGIAIDCGGNAYVTGSTASINFPTTANAFQSALGGNDGTENAFMTKLNPQGSALLYSSYLGGGGTDIGQGVAIDSQGNAYLTGSTNSSDFPTTSGVFQSGLAGNQDAFMAKFAIGAPRVLQIDPNQGPISGGTEVTITGENFLGATAVFFGGASASFVIDSDTKITAISPSGIGTVDVTVSSSLGTSCTSSTDFFTYVQLKEVTVTALNASPNPAECGLPITLKAVVAPSSVTGNVAFFDSSKLIGTVPLINGTAQLSVSTFSTGIHHLTAVYNGDSNHFASTSLSVTLTVFCIPPDPLVLPPLHLKGRQIVRRFATQTERINILYWQPPQEGALIVAYEIYRDATLNKRIAKIPANALLRFEDRNRRKGQTYHYFIVSVDGQGNRSISGEITIRGHR